MTDPTQLRRPRLDLIVYRAVVYGGLAILVIGLYVGVVVGLGGLLEPEPESDPLLAIGATGLVALIFEPARRRLHRLANRMVYGRRATPYEALSRFARSVAATDEGTLDEAARLLAEGTGAGSAAVWVQRGGVFARAAVWPLGDAVPIVRDGIDVADLPGATVVEPVIDEGELLGAVTLEAPARQGLLPTDERLLGQIASGMGLVLRNLRLSQDLRRQIEDLDRSRRRILGVQDEARRSLERRLHEGAQQRLVALKLRLAVAAREARASGSAEVAEILAGVAAETDEAIDALREFARGIYPPLLAAEGLGPALSAQAHRLPVPVTVHAVEVDRYEPDVETAVYFCVLEVLQNVVKHAHASSAHVALHATDEELRFEVSDDGQGFDPVSVKSGSGLANLADRIDAVGGAVEIDSAPGKGTIVRGEIPIRLQEPVP